MADFNVNVIVDPRGARRGTERVRNELEKTERSANRLRGVIARAFAFVSVAAATKQLITLADTFTQLQNRIGTVVTGTEQLNQVTNQLFQITQNTRSSFQSTVELYTRLSLATRELGVTQGQVLNFTESLNQAVILSGATATEANAAIIQLSQGLASGALRGDELRSVLEQLPAVADVIAKRLNVTRGELRQLGADGKITADVVINAFTDMRKEISDNFAKTIPTVAQSLVILQNQLILTAGEIDSATGLTRTLSVAIIDLADVINAQIVQSEVAATFKLWSDSIEDITKDTKDLSNEFQFLTDIISGSLAFVLRSIQQLPVNIIAAIQIVTVQLAALVDKVAIQTEAEVNAVVIRIKELASDAALIFRALGESIVTRSLTPIQDAIAEAARNSSRVSLEEVQASTAAQIASVDEASQATIDSIRLTRQERLEDFELNKRIIREEARARRDFGERTRAAQRTDTTEVERPDIALTQQQIRMQEKLKRELSAIQIDLAPEEDQATLALEEQTRRRLDVVRRAIEQRVILEKEGAQLILDIQRDSSEELTRIEQERASMQLQAGQNIFASLTEISREFAGEQSSTFQKLFAVTKAFAIADSTIKIAQAISTAFATGATVPQQIAQAAIIASQTANIVSTIAGTQFAGAFQNGGDFTVGGSGGTDSQAISLLATPGERISVQTPQQQKTQENQQQGAGQSQQGAIRIVNVVDPAMVEDFLTSPEGERTLVNVIQRNSGSINTVLT